MGIRGLWKEITPAVRSAHLSEFKGQRVGVDAYCWLHRAVLASVGALQAGQPCEKFITVFMARVELVLRCGAVPVLVFDGKSMPMKTGTDDERKRRRDFAKAEAAELAAQGMHDAASKTLEKAVEVTTEVAYAVIRVARERGITCYVAPYEADAQLAFLCKEGVVQAVISEDSDLMVYSCNTLIAKLDSYGNCDTIRVVDLPQLQGFANLSYEAFMLICILSGCDYVPNLPGVGIKSAIKAVASAPSTSAAINAIATAAGLTPRELAAYQEAVHKAFYCFAHHLVYNPYTKAVEPFNAFPAGVPLEADLLGDAPADPVGVCEAITIDPETEQPYTNELATSVALYWTLRRGVGQRTLAAVVGGRPSGSGGTTIFASAMRPRLRDRGEPNAAATATIKTEVQDSAPIARVQSRFFVAKSTATDGPLSAATTTLPACSDVSRRPVTVGQQEVAPPSQTLVPPPPPLPVARVAGLSSSARLNASQNSSAQVSPLCSPLAPVDATDSNPRPRTRSPINFCVDPFGASYASRPSASQSTAVMSSCRRRSRSPPPIEGGDGSASQQQQQQACPKGCGRFHSILTPCAAAVSCGMAAAPANSPPAVMVATVVGSVDDRRAPPISSHVAGLMNVAPARPQPRVADAFSAYVRKFANNKPAAAAAGSAADDAAAA